MLAMTEPDNSFEIEMNLLAAKYGLSPSEARFLSVMIAQKNAGKADVPEISYAIRQLIYTLRKKLQKTGSIYIVNEGGGRYSMPNISKRMLRAEIGSEL